MVKELQKIFAVNINLTINCRVGLDNALLFVIGVLLVSLLMLLLLRISVQLSLVPSAILQRFMGFLDQRRIPYGVPIAIVVIAVIGKILFTDTILALPA